MDSHVRALSDELEVIGVDAVAVQANVVQLPAPTSIEAGRFGNRSEQRFPGDLVRVLRAAATLDADCGIFSSAATATQPLPASGRYVDEILPAHPLNGGSGITFDGHDPILDLAASQASLSLEGDRGM